MGRKSRKNYMIKPFCYFCGREFDNEKVLIQHQKAKHFKCTECNRKLETANGLLVHMQQVHKIIQRRVPNSLEGRDNISSSIHGMNGVPAEVIEEHRMQHIQKLSNINKQKQQRISWTQINAPGFNYPALGMPLNPQFQANMPSAVHTNISATATTPNLNSNISNNNPSLNGTSAPNSISTSVSNPMAATGFTTPTGFSDGDVKNKLLILDPNGMPINQPLQPAQHNVQESSRQPLLLQTNKILYKSNFSQQATTSSFSASPPIKPTLSLDVNNNTNTFKTSGFDRPFNSLDVPAASDNSNYESNLDNELNSSLLENIEDATFNTTFYKAVGMPPLYMPPPSLGNTKLSYSSDTVSIEELRAKMKFNWSENQT